MKFQIKVPATSANMGPGFDCLGIALELFNTFTVEEASSFSMEIRGEGQNNLALHKGNLFYKAVEKLFSKVNLVVPTVKISCLNEIPLARGLGSSSGAIVGGIMAANQLLGNRLSKEEMLPLAVEMEGHGDNVTPALFGGCQIVLKDESGFVHIPVPLSPGLRGVLYIPDFSMPTVQSRKILPAQLPRSDAVYNISRAALLTLALTAGKFNYLKIATQDRLHQPARKAFFPAMDKLFHAALEAGAAGAYLSGSGSAVMALSVDGGPADEIARAMEKAARNAKIEGRSKIVAFASEGARVNLQT